MPKKTSEINSGAQFSRSSENGRLADSATRAFRILANQPGEVFDFQKECDIRIGDPYPGNDKLRCTSYSAQYEGSSRMVVLCTFQFGTTAGSDSGGADPKSEPPDIRPALWATSVSLMEVPATGWSEVNAAGLALPGGAAVNPAGDMYDGVTRLEPVVTITIDQYEPSDPTRHQLLAGSVNSNVFTIGTLNCFIGSVMFRGVQCRPSVEAWGDMIFRGWSATYEFTFRKNHVKGVSTPLDFAGGGGFADTDIGWDVAIPQTGFNVKAFAPGAGGDKDDYGQPLAHSGGKISAPLALPSNIAVGDKVRGMVKVHEYENGGASQLPSAQPIPLNNDGTPRKESANPKVIVKRYRTAPEFDFTAFNLRGLG